MSDKCLVMFCGGVETQEFFSYELAKEFDRLGYRIFFYNLMSDELSFRRLLRMHEGQAAAFICCLLTSTGLRERGFFMLMTEAYYGIHRISHV